MRDAILELVVIANARSVCGDLLQHGTRLPQSLLLLRNDAVLLSGIRLRVHQYSSDL